MTDIVTLVVLTNERRRSFDHRVLVDTVLFVILVCLLSVIETTQNQITDYYIATDSRSNNKQLMNSEPTSKVQLLLFKGRHVYYLYYND